jgi:hypothetical protein
MCRPAKAEMPAMREVAIIGVGAHATGQFTEKPLKELGYTAIWGALDDAGVKPTDIDAAYVGNSIGGLLTGQEGVRGQVVLQHSGITGIPIVNVENACASARRRRCGARGWRWHQAPPMWRSRSASRRCSSATARARSEPCPPSPNSTCRRWASSSPPATPSIRRSI